MRRTLEERELGTQLLIGHATAPIMAGLSPKVSKKTAALWQVAGPKETTIWPATACFLPHGFPGAVTLSFSFMNYSSRKMPLDWLASPLSLGSQLMSQDMVDKLWIQRKTGRYSPVPNFFIKYWSWRLTKEQDCDRQLQFLKEIQWLCTRRFLFKEL